MVFVGLSPEAKGESAAVEGFVREFDIPWLTGYDAHATIDRLGVRGLPTLLVADGQGKVVWNDEMGGSLESAIEKGLSGL